MILPLGLAVLTVVIVLALISAGPATRRSRYRSATRRAAFVRAHPHHANSGDVIGAFAREGVGSVHARSTLDTAAARGVSEATLWQWVDQHGVGALTMVAEAEQAYVITRPDSAPVAAPRVNVAPTAASDDFPDDDPDDWPAPEGATRARVSLSDNVSRDGGRSSAA